MHAHTFGTLILSLVLTSGLARAHQPTPESQEPTQGSASENIEQSTPKASPNHDIHFEASIETRLTNSADFDTGIGEFKVSQYAASIKASRIIGDASLLSLEFGAGLLDYDINPSASSVAGDAANIGSEFDQVTTLSLMALFADRTDEGSSWFVGAGVMSNSEQGADFGDSIDGMITGGYMHKFTNKFELGLGVAIRTRLDDDVLIVPIPQLKYTIDDSWSLYSEGVGLGINYKASDDLNYGLKGKFESQTFRLDDSHASAVNGMATHSQFPLSFYVNYEPNDTIVIKGAVGAMLGGELEILNTAGNNVATEDIDTGIFGSLAVSFKF
ncbi:MAG: hypothetical protein ACWA5W_01395 [Phycisphaerales bacterium]